MGGMADKGEKNIHLFPGLFSFSQSKIFLEPNQNTRTLLTFGNMQIDEIGSDTFLRYYNGDFDNGLNKKEPNVVKEPMSH